MYVHTYQLIIEYLRTYIRTYCLSTYIRMSNAYLPTLHVLAFSYTFMLIVFLFLCRDFSNGYLIAEIISWYYPQDIQMHSYINGMSINTKMGNWQQLERVFSKHSLSISKGEVEGTMHCKPGAAAMLVTRLYTILTHRQWAHFDYVNMCIYIRTYVRMYVRMCIRTYENIYVHVYTCTYVRAYMYVRTYMHTCLIHTYIWYIRTYVSLSQSTYVCTKAYKLYMSNTYVHMVHTYVRMYLSPKVRTYVQKPGIEGLWYLLHCLLCVCTYIASLYTVSLYCTYGTFHKKLDDERRSNGRSINGRTPYSRGRTPYGRYANNNYVIFAHWYRFAGIGFPSKNGLF